MKKFYALVAQELDRKKRLEKRAYDTPGDQSAGRLLDQLEKHLDDLLLEVLPSGSGFDAGTKLMMDKCTSEKLVFFTSFHHMSEHGYYTKWTDHNIIVTPCLAFGFNLKVTGRDYNSIKEYISDVFHGVLDLNIETTPDGHVVKR